MVHSNHKKTQNLVLVNLKCVTYIELTRRGARGRAVRALDSEYKSPGFESAAGQHLVPLSKVLYSNCAVVRKVTLSRQSRVLEEKYLMHVKERHRLFEKSRGSSRSDDCTSKIHSSSLGSRVSTACLYAVRQYSYEVCTLMEEEEPIALFPYYLFSLFCLVAHNAFTQFNFHCSPRLFETIIY